MKTAGGTLAEKIRDYFNYSMKVRETAEDFKNYDSEEIADKKLNHISQTTVRAELVPFHPEGVRDIIPRTEIHPRKGDLEYPTLHGDSSEEYPTHTRLKDLSYDSFAGLHNETKEHWTVQHKKNKMDLDKILLGDEDDILVHEHSVRRISRKKDPAHHYSAHTIEVCIITDPYLYSQVQVYIHDAVTWVTQYFLIQRMFHLKTDRAVNMKIYQTVHKTLVSAETFLKHKSISSKGGFIIKLNGIRVLKVGGQDNIHKT